MKIERTRNTINGFIWGAAGKVVNTILPFLLRTVMIYKLGVEYLGLNSLFASILQVLSLSELGFSYACVYAMYKPIAEDDYDTVGAIMGYLKKIYGVIGAVLLAAGLLVLPFLDKIISGDVPADVNIYLLYLIFLGNSALSYFFFAYKSSLLSAMQCNDVINKVGLITNTLLRLAQCAVLLLVPNYYVYVIMLPVFTLLNNYIKSEIVDRKYAQYLAKSKISEEIKGDIKQRIVPLIGIKISVVLINAADTLVISAFLGLTETALYNNYFFLMTSVQTIIYEIHSSMLAGVGNALAIEEPEVVAKRFETLHFVNAWLVSLCTMCFVCLFQPFMKIWVGASLMVPDGVMLLVCAYFFITTFQRIIIVYKDAAGLWREDALRCYLACGINIGLNLLTVKFLGLYGVIGSSVFVGFVIDPWMARTVHNKIFKKSAKEFYGYFAKDVFVCVALCGVIFVLSAFLPDGWFGIIIRLCGCVLGGNLLLFLAYCKDKRFREAKHWVGGICKKFAFRVKG